MSKNKPREFWISEAMGQGEYNAVHFDRKPKHWPEELNINQFHAIEYSAYAELQSEVDRLRADLKQKNQHIVSTNLECHRLEDENAELVEALEWYSQAGERNCLECACCGHHVIKEIDPNDIEFNFGDMARQALAKHKESK